MRYAVPGLACGPGVECLNASRWDALHAFVNATDSKLVFGLSYPGGVNSGIWDPKQAAALFRYSKAQGYTAKTTLFGFELGEELTKFRAGTALSGPISTLLTVLSWIYVGIHMCKALPSPVCA